MSQKQSLTQAVRELVGQFSKNNIRKIDEVLDLAQNKKEYGGFADGTVSEDLFTAGRMIVKASEELLDAIIQFKRVLIEEKAKSQVEKELGF